MEVMAMEAIAHARFVRITARKVRLVLDLLREKSVPEAYAILRHTPRAASPVIAKIIKSAVANAVHNHDLDETKLFIATAYANEGPTLKRVQPRSQGRAMQILKRTSHITIQLQERS
jgi:large subunit ribosomal protein L22